MGGRIGVLTVVEGSDEEAAKDVAMHIAAINQNMFLQNKLKEKKSITKEKY